MSQSGGDSRDIAPIHQKGMTRRGCIKVLPLTRGKLYCLKVAWSGPYNNLLGQASKIHRRAEIQTLCTTVELA